MNQSDLPDRFPIPFANGATGSTIRALPTNHQTATSTDAPASLEDGFPIECFTPEGSGGVPPNGKDFNAILKWLSEQAQWTQAGGPAIYNAAFSAAIGGYPKGARLASSVTAGAEWLNLVDGNTTNPDGVGAANWARVGVAEAVLSTNGYERRASGVLELWGQVSIGRDSTATISFASLFPGLTIASIFNVQLSWADSTISSGSPMGSSGISSPSTGGFTIYNDGDARVHHWRALGR